MRTRVPLNEIPGTASLVESYASDFGKVARWFHYNPHDQNAVAQRLAELQGAKPAPRVEATQAVVAQQEQWGCGAAAQQAASLLGQPNTYSVVAGQQTGLFGGPVYTQLKAASTVLLARDLATKHPGCNFVPTFWMATGDSDFAEVRKAYLIDRQGALRELALDPEQPGERGIIVPARNVSKGIARLLANTADWMPGGEHGDEVAGALKDAYLGYSLSEGFARWMARLFDGTELVLIDPQDPSLKATAFGLMQDELANCRQIEPKLRTRNGELEKAGFKPQVTLPKGDTSLFLLGPDKKREKIICGGDHYQLRPSGQRVGREEMHELARTQPGRFVAGVLLRPIYQNTLFPVAAFIGGGGELAYRAQATALFDHHHQKMAPAFFRASATLLTSNSAALLNTLGWELTDCFGQANGLSSKAAAGDLPQDVATAIEDYRKAIATADSSLVEKARAIDPSLEKSFATLRVNLDKHIDRMEKKITSAIKQRNESRVKQIERLGNLVYPQQALQERVLSVLSFLPRYGFGLVGQLLDKLRMPCYEHQVVILD